MMKLVPFIADNAKAALAQIQEQLGPDAVVVSVRKLPSHGISRLWQRGGQIEVLACLPDGIGAITPRGEPAKVPAHKIHAVPPGVDAYVPFGEKISPGMAASVRTPRRWQSIAWLESLGLLPVFADELEQKVRATHGDEPRVRGGQRPPSTPSSGPRWSSRSARSTFRWCTARPAPARPPCFASG